jgi:filamentous hemagglutinin family protein
MASRHILRRASHGGLRAIHLCSCLIVALPLIAKAAGIVADGGTATTVSAAANGGQTVNIAPAISGVSQNTYGSFNVSTAGATLNNVGINARTIVNQVTSTNPSLIEGAITVAGPRANVVLANPNGITVNGGSFVNTGHVALSTGTVSFSDLQIAPGVFQRDVVLDTRTGTVTVGPLGLASALIGLDLIAKNILIQGPVSNGFSSSTASVRAIAGTSHVALNTALSPTDNANDWLTLTPPATPDTAASFAVDITAAGSLSSGRVQLIVTDKGPGVRSAGALNATLGDFTLTSAGNVEIENTSVTAAQNLSLQVSDSISLSNTQIKANGGTATLTADGPISFTASSLIASGGVELSGNGIELLNDGLNGSTVASGTSGVTLKSSGDIVNTGSLVQGQSRIAGNADSSGAVTLTAAGDIVNQSTLTSPLGILFGKADDVSLSAGGAITNRNARILSNTNVTIAATGDFSNVVDHVDGVGDGVPSWYSNRGRALIFLETHSNGFAIDYGSLADPAKLAYVTADSGNVKISANNVLNSGGSILSNGGSVSVVARGALTNEASFTGQAAYDQSCFIFCRSHASSAVQAFGGVIEAGTDIDLKSSSQITNRGGTVLAVGTLSLDAPKTLAQGVMGYTAVTRSSDLKAWFGNTWSAIYASDTGGIFSAGSGHVTITGEADIDGGVFSAPGGVQASGGVITLRAPYRAPVTIGNHNHVGLVSWFGL